MANPTPALETQLALLQFFKSERAMEEASRFNRMNPESDCQIVADTLETGYPYYVDPMICDLLSGSIADFPEVSPRDVLIPGVSGWIHFAVPLVLSGVTLGAVEGIKGFSWHLWREVATGHADHVTLEEAKNPSLANQLEVCVFLDDLSQSLPLFGWQFTMEMNESWLSGPTHHLSSPQGLNRNHLHPDELGGDIPDEALEVAERARAYFHCFMAFIEQSLIDVADAIPARATRRRAASHFHEDPIIKVVKLRRSESARSPDPSNAGDWAFQWLVSGHWRRQWYPASNRHKPIWISPHVKGPENKPLKRASIQLYSVER